MNDTKDREILVNMIATPDGTILQSRNRHDYVSHVDNKDGNTYFTDGGSDYIHRSIGGDYTPLDCYTDTPHHITRQYFDWGTYGKCGTLPLRRVLLKDLDTSHIRAIIDTQTHLPSKFIKMFIRELKYRETN